MPVFVNSYYYEVIKYFLSIAEHFEAQFIKDLEVLIPLYTKTEEIHEKLKSSDRSFIDDWAILESSNEDNNNHLIGLKNAIIEWAKKYNLYSLSGNNKTFLEIATWAIPGRRDHEKDIIDKMEFLERVGRELPLCEYRWSITDAIYYEDESEILKEKLCFNKLYPFVFTPKFFNFHEPTFLNLKPAAYDYENIFGDYDMDVNFALQGKKEDITGYTRGIGWDPRAETWSQFEENLDNAYKKYKELYKERTKSFMQEHGYVEGKQKRNKEHFEWLVRYQIQEWNIKKITDYYSKDNKILSEDTIRKGIASTAKLIELDLR